jgi:acyl-coenzyme A synthetase/AMP-(fatty) acid ligase
MGDFNYQKEYDSWKWDIPTQYNIGYDVVDKHTKTNKKNHIALFWEDEQKNTKTFTFLEMKNLTNKCGNLLKSLNITKGDRYLIRIPNIPEFHISFLGGIKIGAVPIPSSVMFRSSEIQYRINDSKAKAVITTSTYLSEVLKIQKNCPSLNHIIVIGEHQKNTLDYTKMMHESSINLDIEQTTKEDMSFFCYTSGTTGDPKGAVHKHQWVEANDPSLLYWQAAKENDIIAHTGDLSWIYPLGNGFLYPWRWGISTFIYNGKFYVKKWFELLEKYKITNLASVPTAYRLFITIKKPQHIYDLSHLRHCISAGEPLNPEVIKKWEELFGIKIYDGIGMTEIMVYLSNMINMKIKLGSCGKPQPGKKCAIVDSHGIEKPFGEPGILAVNKTDPGLFKEYWNKTKKTNDCFKNEWFLTGDILYQDEDGYFWFNGRDDDLIMASGYRISPFEVESAIISHPEVLEAAVVASPDEIRGVIVKAYVILRSNSKASTTLISEIQTHCKTVAAPYKYPREIEFVETLPKTQSGKIKRKELREREIKNKGVLK